MIHTRLLLILYLLKIADKFLVSNRDSFFLQGFGILGVIIGALGVPILMNRQILVIGGLTFLLIQSTNVELMPSHLVNSIVHSLLLESYLVFPHLQ